MRILFHWVLPRSNKDVAGDEHTAVVLKLEASRKFLAKETDFKRGCLMMA